MFINASTRTDIASRYSEWLMNRVHQGYVLSRSPYAPHKVYRYRLHPDVVDCFIFCTKNPAPMLPYIEELRRRGFAALFYVTITSYGKDMEPGVPDYHEVTETFRKLSMLIGKNNICWRYDPILLTEKYTIPHHLTCFEEMAKELSPYTNICIFSFVEIYQKFASSFPSLRAVSEPDKKTLLTGMAKTAAKYSLRLQTCGDIHDYALYGISRSGCISVPIMEKALGRELQPIKPHPSRKGCGCLPSGDIGAYDTCPNGCKYCYATKDHALAAANCQKHSPLSPLIFGKIHPEDEIVEASQKSFLLPFEQLHLDLSAISPALPPAAGQIQPYIRPQ